MSPGVTFERVYHELKRRLADGTLRPGQPIEPAAMSAELAASITPVRDALHRLVGERLVEAPNHNGFRVPLPTEAVLRDLYSWNVQLLGLAVRRLRPRPPGTETIKISPDDDVVAATANLFVEIARAPGSAEHVRAIQQLNDRLAPYRRLEVQMLNDVIQEFDLLTLYYRRGERAHLIGLLERYRRRRLKIVPALLVELHNLHESHAGDRK